MNTNDHETCFGVRERSRTVREHSVRTSIYRERTANEHERSTNGDPAAGYRERTANERVRERFANAVRERNANAQP